MVKKYKNGDEVYIVTNWMDGNWDKALVVGGIENEKSYLVKYCGMVNRMYENTMFKTEDDVRKHIYSAWCKK